VHEIIPKLEAMEHDLAKVHDSLELPTVIRIAMIAALLIQVVRVRRFLKG
jgi:hypothetical protein